MAVRPFYIDANIEGRRTNLAGGTAKKDGQQSISIKQRDKGDITTPFKIEQSSFYEDGVHKLVTRVYYLGDLLKEHITDY